MALKKELIQFTISNETDCSINLPLFQQNVYSINATTKYSWDITSEVLACGTGTIVVNGVALTLNFTPTLTGLLNALNALGFGFFCTETIGGSTFLYVVDDTNVYGGVDICPSATTTTTTTTSTTTIPPTTTTTTTSTTTIAYYAVDFRVSELAATGQDVKLWYSTNGGATWNFYVLANAALYPNYNVYAGLQFPAGTNLLLGITDVSDVNIEYGEGNFSGDFTSKCGLSNPFVITNLSATTSFYANLNVSGGNFVPCSGTTTTTTTTSTTTLPPETTTTTTTSTTTLPPETTTTTTTSTTTTNEVLIYIDNTNSLDIPITGMTINGVAVTYVAGSNFTISAGNNGDFSSTELGTLAVVITYGSHISGQKITFTDSSSNVTCKDLNGSAGSFTIPASSIIAGTTIYVLAEDGACI